MSAIFLGHMHGIRIKICVCVKPLSNQCALLSPLCRQEEERQGSFSERRHPHPPQQKQTVLGVSTSGVQIYHHLRESSMQ